MKVQRIEAIDLARGIALAAMTIFHFAFDLELFGLKEPGFIAQPHWKYFARAIASSFLFLAGVSLFLANANDMDWKKWRKRMMMIVGAAMLITVATYFATPNQYIFFGILHSIAFASVAGLLFLRLPWQVTAVAAVAVFSIRYFGRSEVFDSPALYWTGLSVITPNSSDFVPVFPWLSAPLLGIAFAKYSFENGYVDNLARPKFENSWARPLKFIGRHSLAYYLLHQPIMIAVLVSILWLAGRI